MKDKKFDLTERLEDFEATIILVYNQKPMSYAGDYLAKQRMRSSGSSALNQGDVLGVGADKDKINKLRICLKQLREYLRDLNIQTKARLIFEGSIRELKDENDQLIRIIVIRIKNIN